jgi:Lipopolysaccharide-assembly
VTDHLHTPFETTRCAPGRVLTAEQDRRAARRLSRRTVLRVGSISAAFAALSGCGYALAGRGNTIPDYIRTLGVPMFGNRTPFSPMEQLFTEKVRVEFQSRGRYQVLPTDAGVDGLVRGEIMSIGVAPAGFNPSQQASRYRFTVVIGVSFADAKQKKVIWENPSLSFTDEYELASANSLNLAVSAGAGAFIDQERAAVDRLTTDFARSVVSAILEAF